MSWADLALLRGKGPTVEARSWPVTRKYRNARTRTADGITHPSKKQAMRWSALLLLQHEGRIRNLKREVTYHIAINGHKVCKYVADHVYEEYAHGAWHQVVEDVKGMLTPMYRLKRKLMKAVHGIEIREV